jgi:protein toll
VITHGDVEANEQMDEELRSYLRLHLFVKHEDPRFWQKLLYAMPHRRNNQARQMSRNNEFIKPNRRI